MALSTGLKQAVRACGTHRVLSTGGRLLMQKTRGVWRLVSFDHSGLMHGGLQGCIREALESSVVSADARQLDVKILPRLIREPARD